MGTKSCSRKSSRMDAMRLGAVACSRKRRFICRVHGCLSTLWGSITYDALALLDMLESISDIGGTNAVTSDK